VTIYAIRVNRSSRAAVHLSFLAGSGVTRNENPTGKINSHLHLHHPHITADVRFVALVAVLRSQPVVYSPSRVTLLLRLLPVVLQPLPNYRTIRAEYRKLLLLSFFVAPRFTSQSLLDRVSRMAGLSRQFADVLAIDPVGRPDVVVLIHPQQLLTSGLDKKSYCNRKCFAQSGQFSVITTPLC